MAKQISDDEQNLRRKARRRLIGAFAFTLAVVVILPMILDNEPKPSGQGIELRIPAADEVGEFVPKKVAPVEAEVRPTSSLADIPAVKSDAATAGNGKSDDTQNVKSSGTVKPASAAESFVAQVGAYSNADTARQELEKLKKWGFRAYTEKAAGMIRVRVGPYTDREKAEKARQQLEKHGLHPVVMSDKGS